MEDTELLEKLADLEHQQWIHWERYREARIEQLIEEENRTGVPSGESIMKQEMNWKRLRETPYEQLTEKEKDSDREWAKKVVELLESFS